MKKTYFLLFACLFLGLLSGMAQNSMNMPVTGSSVFYTCSGSVFDDGGMVNPYSCNVNNSILVVYSDTMQPGSKLSVTGNYALEENVDFLYIYEGADTNGLLLYTCTGIGSLPPLYSMAGPFTLKFYTNDINCEESGFNLFFTCSSCPSVPNVSLSDVTSTSAVVAWGAIPGSSYELVCVTPNVSPYEVQPIPVNDTFYTVTGLNVNSHYRVYVRTVCGTSDYSPFNQATIITTQIPADIPYTCDFENGAINSEWTFLASSSVNRWCVGSAINNTPGGDSALYITNDHLLTYAYSPNSPTVVWAYRDIHFTSYEEYLLSFDWQCGGDQFYNIGMDVFIGDPAFVKALPVNSTDVPAGAVLLLSARNAQNWTPFQYSLGSEYTGTTKRLYFRWTNIDHYNIGNPGAIDNISIMGFNCTRPTTLSAANITGNTVDISFVPGHVSDTEWEYAIGAFGSNPDNLTPVPVTSTTFTISNLSSSSLYHLYIRTICNDGTSDWSDLLTFRTNCGTISTLPYLENFDFYASGTYPACWIRFPYPNSSYPIVAEGTYYSPSRSLYFYTDSWGASNNMIIAPPIDTSISMSTIKISFKAYGQVGTPFQVGVLTDPENDLTFYPIQTCIIATGATWTTFEVVLNQYEGAGRYIGFKVSRDANGGYYGYIDNVKFETFSNCPRPEGIALSTISDVGATISWQAGNTAEAWDVVYVAQYADPSVGVPVRIENNEYQITTMNSNTHYDVYVRSVCEDGSVSNWSLPVSFRTNCHLYEAPFNETFDAFAFPPICWERYTGLASHIFAGEDFSTAPGIQWERIVLPNGLPTPHAMVQVFTSYCDAWLVSPPIDLSNVENPMLNFNLALTQHGNGNPIADVLNGADDKFMVAILGENDQHWSRAHSYVWDNTGNGNFVYNEIANEGEYISIPLSQYGSQVRVAFYAESTSQNANTDIHIDDIYVGEHVGCVYASVPVLINSASNAVTVSWLRGFEEEKWQLVCGASGVDIDTLTPITLQDTSYTITGLNPNTFYDIYIRSICTSNDTSRWSGRLKVLTAQANIAELPYSCNFENATENANWILVNDTLINKWVFGQAVETVDGGTHSLYVSDDNGVTNTYDISSSSRIWAYRDFNFDEGLEYELSFDYKLKGEVFVNVYNQEIWYDYLSVYVGNPAQTIASAFPFSIPEGAVIVTKLANTLEWRRASITLPGDFTGTTKRIYFAWENNHYDGENPPAAIDNISLKPVFCRKPQSVIASNITAYEATITIENIFDESDWEIRYAPAGSLLDTIPGILVANSQSYNITGLTPDTEYEVYVRNICSDIDTSVWKTPIVFRTGCVSITELPYMENFDRFTYNLYPPCWGKLSGTPGFNDVELFVFNAFSEPNSIKLSPNDNSYCMAITPRIDRDIDSLALSFRLFRYINSDCLEIGVMTDPEDISTFVTVDTIEPSLIETWLFCEVPMLSYEGDGKYIAFRSSIGNIMELNTVLIDNVQLDIAPDCYKPFNVNVGNITTNSALFSWSERNPVPATSWTIEYGVHGFTPGTGTLLTVNTNPYLFTGLNPRTVYDVRVRSNCNSDAYSDWSVMSTFRTFSCDTASMCDYLFQLNSVHGAGWSGASLSVMANGILEVDLSQSIDDEQFTVPLCMGDTISLIWHSGTLDSTLSFVILDQFNQEVYRCNNADTLNSGFIFGFINNCGYAPCLKPTNLEANIVNTDVQLTWTRGSDQDQRWILEYKEQSEDQFIVKNCNFNSYTILDIIPDVMYEARVKTICANGESEFTDLMTFGITGMEDQIMTNQVVLFPNPAHDFIELRISDGNLHVNNIGVYDVYGKLVKMIPLQDDHAAINVQDLASGVYFVRLNCEQGIITKKFVKQ